MCAVARRCASRTAPLSLRVDGRCSGSLFARALVGSGGGRAGVGVAGCTPLISLAGAAGSSRPTACTSGACLFAPFTDLDLRTALGALAWVLSRFLAPAFAREPPSADLDRALAF